MTRSRSTRLELSAERFFLRQPLQLATVELEGPEAHHLLHVLRANVGDRVGLFNGEGDEALAEITAIKKRTAELRITKIWTVPAPARELTLAVALPKGDRARWLIEKGTELGVSRVIPLRTNRSVVEPGESKLEKLEQAVIAASKQCGRSRLLQISPLTALDELFRAPMFSTTLSVLADPHAEQSLLRLIAMPQPSSSSILALIGPEGGFDQNEVAASIAAGAKPMRLGQNILRIETAAIAIAAVWQATHSAE